MSLWSRGRPFLHGPGGSFLPEAAGAGLVLLVSLCLLPAPAGSQTSQELVAESELEYRSARSAYQAARDARSAAERRFTRALQEIEDARTSSEEDRIESAFARAQEQAIELQGLEQRVRRTSQRLEEAREDLLAALDQRLEALVSELSGASSRPEQEELAALIRDIRNRVREVERAGEWSRETRLVALPEVSFDPRDGPVELQWKAELLERRASQYQDRIREIDREMDELRRRQRRNRNLQDMLAGIERFDDDQVPVTARQNRRDPDAGEVEAQEGAPDSAGATVPDRTLEERIESLEVLRSRIESYREQVMLQARQFRQRAQEIS